MPFLDELLALDRDRVRIHADDVDGLRALPGVRPADVGEVVDQGGAQALPAVGVNRVAAHLVAQCHRGRAQRRAGIEPGAPHGDRGQIGKARLLAGCRNQYLRCRIGQHVEQAFIGVTQVQRQISRPRLNYRQNGNT